MEAAVRSLQTRSGAEAGKGVTERLLCLGAPPGPARFQSLPKCDELSPPVSLPL